MDINKTKTSKWKLDSRQSVMHYNEWYLKFAPQAYKEARDEALDKVDEAMELTDNFSHITINIVYENPSILTSLRMACQPPLAVDRLAGLADVPKATILSLENGRMPARLTKDDVNEQTKAITRIIRKLTDKELMPWIHEFREADDDEIEIARCVIADRLCASMADPAIRKAQEERQFKVIAEYLEGIGYTEIALQDVSQAEDMPSGTYAFHVNVPVTEGNGKSIKMPIDVAVKRTEDRIGDMPILIECKSAGDFANTNKRRKEEAQKINQLRKTYGADEINFILFLGGYFDAGYLGYEAAEGIDWVWEHRVSDLSKAGL